MQTAEGPRAVMLGAGAYDQHSTLQAGVVGLAASQLERAVRALTAAGAAQVSPSGAAPVCLADYGSASGKNAVAAMLRLGELIGQHLPPQHASPARPLALCFCDQADNDWKVLASRLHDAFAGRDEVTFAMFPRSFYGPVLPPASVDLGWSAIAVHWLSRKPSASVEHLWPHPALGAQRAPFGEQARRDWRVFLEQRARELRAGGQLVVVAACSGADGRSTADAYLDVPWEVMAELERTGQLWPEERAAMHIPIYFRCAEEWQAPLREHALPLELVDYREALLPDGLWQEYERSGDRVAFANAWVGWLRAFSEPLLAAGLHPRRDARERAAVLDALYERTAAIIASAPERARIPWTLAIVHAARR
jgi:hypothetical protein